MFALPACCAAQTACCLGSSLLGCCCRGGSSSGRQLSGTTVKILYLFFLIISVTAAMLLRNYGSHMFVSLYSFQFGCTGSFAEHCYGNQAVFRVSFGLAVFFFFMLVASPSVDINSGFWGIKLLLYVVATVGAFFIPNDVFNVYAEIARIVSIVFLLLMIIILVDFAYTVQEWLGGKMDEREELMKQEYETVGLAQNPYKGLYVLVVFLLVVGSIAAIIAMYVFSVKNECGGTTALLSVTLVVGFILLILSGVEALSNPGFLVGSLVWLYCVWLMWSAMVSSPDVDCNPYGADQDSGLSLAIGMIITGLSLAYTAYSAASSVPGMCGGSTSEANEHHPLSTSLVADSAHPATVDHDVESAPTSVASPAQIDASKAIDEHDVGTDHPQTSPALQPNRAWIFHLVMLTAAMYLAMLLSNWGTGNDMSTANTSYATYWIKIVSQWVTFLLYTWTLVAPRVCPNREFR